MTGGIVLCGGRSERMGRPKAWLPVGAESMLAHVVRVVADVSAPVLVVAAPGQDVPNLPAGVEVARDEVEGNGPLQGLAAGLTALAGRAEAAVVTGCDAPLLTPPFLRRLVALRGSFPICVPATDGHTHPLPGVYAVAVLSEVRALLAARRYRLGGLLDRVPPRLLTAADFADLDLEALRNVNTPDDYARALIDLGLRPDEPPAE